MEVPKPLMIEQTGIFSFELNLKRNKLHLKLELVKLTISVYYTEEVGFQETDFVIEDDFEVKEYLVVIDGEENYFPNQKNLLLIKPLKLEKQYLKKL